jgi:soluble lytic murein transglycosylase
VTRPAFGWGVLAAGVLLLASPAEPARADFDLEAQRKAFAAALRDAEAGVAAPAGGDSAALAEYPLYPYVEAARLRAALAGQARHESAQPLDQAAANFLARHGSEPVSRLVRRPWLLRLAARQQWAKFMEAYGQVGAPDQQLRCLSLQARIALGATEGLAEQATAEWLTPRSADDACDPVFDWLRGRKLLGPSLMEQRARLALAAGEPGLARWLARSLPEESARPLREWALLIESPLAAIDALVGAPSVAVEDDALLDGWTRLARRDPQAAKDRFDALAAARPQLASRFARALALGLAWSRYRSALEFFARIDAADFDEMTHEWHVRSALLSGDWTRVAAAVAAMPAALRETPRWQYWAARAAEAAGERERARELYAAVIPSDNWFAVLSAARLGERFAPHDRALTLDPVRIAALEQGGALLRARELFVAGLVPLAQSEWNAGYAALDGVAQRDAIGLAHLWGWHFQAIATAAQQRIFDDYRLLYPVPFEDMVAQAAHRSGLPPTLVLAVIRQESLYQSWTVSSAGAIGLMQLLPTTARQTAKAIRSPPPGRSDLMEPAVNISIGSAHLAELIERFDGQVLVALAAYNAGPNAARRWLPERPLDADVWVENIPYNETRAYVQRIMWHSVVFEWLKDGQPEDATAWLVQVKPDD